MKPYLSAAILLGPLVATGCSANNSGNTMATCNPLTQTKAAASPAWTGSVFTIVMENKSRGDVLGNGAAPFINQLAKQNAIAEGYHDSFVHPSEPNYLWMIAGE